MNQQDGELALNTFVRVSLGKTEAFYQGFIYFSNYVLYAIFSGTCFRELLNV